MSTARMTYRSPGPRYIPEDYPLIRSVADPRIAELDTEDLEAELLRQGLRAEDMESFLSDVGSAFSSAGSAIGHVVSKAAPVVGQYATKALPGVISGAAAGCALGPWGCLGGALVGGVTSALTSSGSKSGSAKSAGAGGAAGVAGSIASALPAVAGAFGGGGAVSGIATALPAIAGLVGGSGNSAGAPASAGAGAATPGAAATNPAGVLLGLIQRPEVIQALMSMTLGSAGRKDIPVGSTAVPVSAFANLLSVLGSKAFGHAEAFAEPGESLPEYLYRDGTLMADPAERSERAAVLLERLGEVAVPIARALPRPPMSEADAFYDELDAAELDLMEMEGGVYEFDE